MFCVVFINGICFALRIDCCSSNSADGGNVFHLTEVFIRSVNFTPETYFCFMRIYYSSTQRKEILNGNRRGVVAVIADFWDLLF